MCQQWLSFLGLLADVIGFVLIAWEWYRAFTHSVFIRNRELEDAERRMNRKESEEGETVEADEEPTLAEEEETMAREFSKLHNKEAGFRRWLFVTGALLVVLGFLLQAAGAMPASIAMRLGIGTCS